MGNLTKGQRIDVYEVVYSPYAAAEEKDIGNHFIGVGDGIPYLFFIPLAHYWDWNRNNGLCYGKDNVKKVGTFIVKSLKGGNG